MLVIMAFRSIDCRRSGNRETLREVSRSKERPRRAVYQAKYKVERKRHGKCHMFEIEKRIVKTYQDFIGEQFIKNENVRNSLEKLSWEAVQYRVCMV